MDYTKKLLYQSNYWYNDGLGKAKIRDMSGAITSLRKSLQYNGENTDARNLLGLVYYGRGEVAEALVEWIISKNLKPKENLANHFIRKLQNSEGELETVNQAVRKFNQSLAYCEQGAEDLAIIQLKKVVSAHPTFLKAYQLLALLYIQNGQYSKANQALRTARKLDTTNEMTLRYIHEVTKKKVRKSKDPGKTASNAISYQDGNETIIQPAMTAFKGTAVRIAGINLLIGILLGAAVIWFLVMPAKIKSNNDKNNKQIKEFSAQLEEQEAQISAQTKALDEYRGNSDKAQEAQETAAGTQDSYENLLNVYQQYQNGDTASTEMADALLNVNRDSLGSTGQAIYDQLSTEVLDVVAQRQYQTGVNALQEQDYASAVTALSKVVQINEQYDDGNALYNLGLAYSGSGDAENAKTYLEKVIQLFPNTDIASAAQTVLDGGTADSVAGSSGETTDDGDNGEDSEE